MPPRRNPPPAPDPQIARNAHNTASLRGSHVQLMTCCWRIVRAVEALPKNPDEMTVKRWNAGLARELVGLVPVIQKSVYQLHEVDSDRGHGHHLRHGDYNRCAAGQTPALQARGATVGKGGVGWTLYEHRHHGDKPRRNRRVFSHQPNGMGSSRKHGLLVASSPVVGLEGG